MATNNIYADINELDELSNNIRNKTLDMNNILDELITMTIDMDKFFDTPQGKVMKDSLIDYLKDSKKKCTSLNYICDGLDSSKKIYKSVIDGTRNSVRG